MAHLIVPYLTVRTCSKIFGRLVLFEIEGRKLLKLKLEYKVGFYGSVI